MRCTPTEVAGLFSRWFTPGVDSRNAWVGVGLGFGVGVVLGVGVGVRDLGLGSAQGRLEEGLERGAPVPYPYPYPLTCSAGQGRTGAQRSLYLAISRYISLYLATSP